MVESYLCTSFTRKGILYLLPHCKMAFEFLVSRSHNNMANYFPTHAIATGFTWNGIETSNQQYT